MMKLILTISALFFVTACDNTSRFLDCVDGCSNSKGEQGEVGLQGPVGPQGEQGDSSTIETIELCPDINGTPGSFHEYLVRIDGSLYGVYAKGQKIGLTKLSSGVWTTTDGRNCTFIVHLDGSVTF